MRPTEYGECSECGAILTENDYVNENCSQCGAEMVLDFYGRPEHPIDAAIDEAMAREASRRG